MRLLNRPVYIIKFHGVMYISPGVDGLIKPRNVAIYLIRLLRSERLTIIAGLFGIKGYSTVSSVVQRVRELKKKEKKTQKEIDDIIKILNKGQVKTRPLFGPFFLFLRTVF